MTEPAPLPPMTGPSAGSPVVALAYVGAAALQLLFLKGCAVYLELSDFGAIQVAFSLSFATSFVAMALRAASATRAADAAPSNAAERFDRLARRLTAIAGGAAALFAVLPVADRLSLPNVAVAAAMPILVAVSILHGVSTGTVLGSERDRRFAALIVFEPALRCLIAALLFSIGVASDGLGPVLAMIVSLGATAGFGRLMFPAEPPGDRPRRARRQPLSAPVTIAALAAYGLLLASDIPLARLVLDADEASRYAGIAVASRFLVLLPFPISLLLLARLRGRAGRVAPVRELARALAAVAIGDVVFLFLLNEFGGALLELLLAPDHFDGLRDAYVGYAVAAALYGLAQLLLFFGIALGHVSLVLLPSAVMIVQIPLFLANGGSLRDCVTIAQTMALLLVFTLTLVVLLPRAARALAQRARQGAARR